MANHNLPRSAKIVVSRIPEPQVQRILQRHAKGESIRAISRAEKRSRECVTRIVTSEQAQQLVQSMRAEFYGLADDAIAAVRHTLQSQKDGRLGYKFLMDIGVVPVSGDEGFNAMQVTPLDKALTPLERVSATDDSGRINPLGLVLSRVAEVTAKAYGFSLPTPAEIWRNRTLAALVDEITAGNNQYLDLSNPAEWNRIRDLAEGVLQGKHGMDDQEIVAVRKKYESED